MEQPGFTIVIPGTASLDLVASSLTRSSPVRKVSLEVQESGIMDYDSRFGLRIKNFRGGTQCSKCPTPP